MEAQDPMNELTPQFDLLILLKMSGARIRGSRRADCPECKRFRSVSFNDRAFCCHGLDCQFKGVSRTLSRRLGIQREWLPRHEYIRQRLDRERAEHAAATLYAAVRARWLMLIDRLHELNKLELRAHADGATQGKTWDALGVVYSERPMVLAELAILENSGASHLIQLLGAGGKAQARTIARVVERGFVSDSQGRIVEVMS
jgi:hypothetical protein